MSEKAKLLLLQTLVGLAAVGAWHILSVVPIGGVYLLPPFFFSTPADVAMRVWTLFAEGTSKLAACTEPIDFGRLLSISAPCFGKTIYQHLLITLIEGILAFAIGALLGAPIGFWLARSRRKDPTRCSAARCRGGGHLSEARFPFGESQHGAGAGQRLLPDAAVDAEGEPGADRRQRAAGVLAWRQGPLPRREVYSLDGVVSAGSRTRSLSFLRQLDKEIAAARIDPAKTWDGRFVEAAAKRN